MRPKIITIVRMVRCIVGECQHEITVRRIGKRWHCRCLVDGVVNQEVAVFNRSDIGFACREMLRWEDKCGNFSKFASAARERHNKRFVKEV